ncbi:MAG: hypothetical protein ACJASY_000692 [Halioglobus sp.]|jgi:hypothetical protein
MAWIKHLPVNAPINEIIFEIEKDGAVIIHGFVSDEADREFNAEIDPILKTKTRNHGHPYPAVEFFHGAQTKHLAGVAGVSDTFVDVVLLHRIFEAIGDAFLIPNCSGKPPMAD